MTGKVKFVIKTNEISNDNDKNTVSQNEEHKNTKNGEDTKKKGFFKWIKSLFS
ncbi:hypothetical protein CLTEP_14520 [Clostridium tepidiprofundi DSM 19306]|uniref:Uncharacterized protein n=1 Tax=Clostridium tepidiprofundi DSM 19306 TaxID=1121338 RepID=A0A151B3X4_9CLOT|nr:hypothetical protein [Clostridium tepidiprofundi]KYH34624.1 hypothetical protein CLTEP_14520 [Clostridium tepidiprofundi DSM 19306]